MEYPEFHLHSALVHFTVALSAFAEDHGLCPWMNAKKLLLRRDVRRRAKPLVIRRRITPGALIHEVNQQGVTIVATGFARGAPYSSASRRYHPRSPDDKKSARSWFPDLFMRQCLGIRETFV